MVFFEEAICFLKVVHSACMHYVNEKKANEELKLELQQMMHLTKQCEANLKGSSTIEEHPKMFKSIKKAFSELGEEFSRLKIERSTKGCMTTILRTNGEVLKRCRYVFPRS